MTKFLTTTAFLAFSSIGFSQILISDADMTPVPCASFIDNSTANFYDTGGSGANYGANENETITFCPDAGGSKISLFVGINAGFLWDVDASDTLFVYDGPTTASPLLIAANTITNPFGMAASQTTATWANTTGCITVQFVSDGATEGTGWDANISCTSPWQPMELHTTTYIGFGGEAIGAGDNTDDMTTQDISGALPDTGYVNVCLGDSILFMNSSQFNYEPGAPNGALSGGGYNQSDPANHITNWEFSDGSTQTGDSIWFTPLARTGYFVTMKVEDNLGQFDQISSKIRVSTIPSFATCNAIPDTLCLGDGSRLIGGITAGDTAGVDATPSGFEISGSFGAQTFLPDGSGQNYTTDINIAGFPAGLTLQNSGDLEDVCISMEHSYLGDLEMMLTCPNGSSVMIFNAYTGNGLFSGGFGGSGTFLGGATDASTAQGNCEQYCFSEAAGSLPSWVNGYNTITATVPPGQPAGIMVEPGTYNPEESYVTQLTGCPLNGTWTLTVRDNLGTDDGWICEWGIFFNATLNPNNETYVPTIVSEAWGADPTILAGSTDTAILVLPTTVGSHGYTFAVVDNYGCHYDTTINVVTEAGPSIQAGGVTCDDQFGFNNTYAPSIGGTTAGGGGIWSVSGPGSTNFTPNDQFLNPTLHVTTPGTYTITFVDNRCGDTLTETVVFAEDPTANITGETVICENDTAMFMTTIQTGESVTWFGPNVTSTGNVGYGTESGFYYVEVMNACSTDSAGMELVVESCSLPNIITPNGTPGKNDFFYTNYANNFTDVNLTIFNRWGRIVYKTESYNNTWNGVNMNGKKVAGGTYFYTMTWDNGTKDASGFITVMEGR